VQGGIKDSNSSPTVMYWIRHIQGCGKLFVAFGFCLGLSSRSMQGRSLVYGYGGQNGKSKVKFRELVKKI
jgi:hypothetical protein